MELKLIPDNPPPTPSGLQCAACLNHLPGPQGPQAITVVSGFAVCRYHMGFFQSQQFNEVMTTIRGAQR